MHRRHPRIAVYVLAFAGCEKYGLAIGHVSRYLGEVPPCALAQIKANRHHVPTIEIFDAPTYERKFRAELERLVAKDPKAGLGHMIYRQTMGKSWGSSGMSNPFPTEHGMVMVPGLHIAAPIKDMKLEWNERVREDGQIVEAPMNMDPIVCIEVKGGYIVLAAWGEEGQDPKVFNAESN